MNKNKAAALFLTLACALLFMTRLVITDYSGKGASDTFFIDLTFMLLLLSVLLMVLVRFNETFFKNRSAAVLFRFSSCFAALTAFVFSFAPVFIRINAYKDGNVNLLMITDVILRLLQSGAWLGLTAGIILEGLLADGFSLPARKLLCLLLSGFSTLVLVFIGNTIFNIVSQIRADIGETVPNANILFVLLPYSMQIGFTLFLNIWLILTGLNHYKKARIPHLQKKTWKFI